MSNDRDEPQPEQVATEQDLSSWMELTKQLAQQLDDRASVFENYYKHGQRQDGRQFLQPRDYQIQRGIMTHAAGSALCQAGSTLILTSISLQVGQPAPVAPRQGDIMVGLEDGPASLQSFLQRIMDETLELEQLCISEGKLAYRLVATISVLNDGGSLTSVSLVSLVAALCDTRLPLQPKIVDGVVHDDATVDTRPLNLPVVPFALSASGVRNKGFQWIVDPISLEETVQDTSIVVVVDSKTSDLLLVDIAPSIHVTVQPEAIRDMVEITTKHTKGLFELLIGRR